MVIGVHIITRRADQRAAFRWIELGNSLIERIQMNVGHPRIEKAIEAFDEAVDLDLELVAADNSPMNSGVQSRRIASCRQNANAFHLCESLSVGAVYDRAR